MDRQGLFAGIDSAHPDAHRALPGRHLPVRCVLFREPDEAAIRMTFISYSQNFEDVLLRRALAHVDRGFYVDVGANDPEIDSVTKCFYDAGWSGINVEPVRDWHERLVAARTRDLNLLVFATDRSGAQSFYEVEGTGLSTFDAATAARHAARGFRIHERIVETATLDAIFERHGVTEVHFLKIDVEGAEKSVLEGIGFEKVRPWIVVVEATEPLGQASTHDAWESMLLGARYRFVYFDGLNRFYVAEEHRELEAHFRVPPNVTDDFVPRNVVFLEEKLRAVDDEARWRTDVGIGRLEQLRSQLDAIRHEGSRLEAECRGVERQLRSEKKERVRLQSDLAVLEERRRELARRFEAVERAASELDHVLRTPTAIRAIGLGAQNGLLDRSSVALRKRLRKARRYLQKHPNAPASMTSAIGWLDAASRALPEGLARPVLVAPPSSATSEPLGSVWLSPTLGAQVELRRRLRKMRKFVADRRGVTATLPGVSAFLDGVTRLLPVDVGEQIPASALAEVAELKDALAFGRASDTWRASARGTGALHRTAPSVLVLSTYPCERPRHGGQVRLANMLEAYRQGGFHVRSLAVYEPETFGDADVGAYDEPFPVDSPFRTYRGRFVPLITDLLAGHFAAADDGGYGRIRAKLDGRVDVIHLEQPWLLPLARRLLAEHPGTRGATVVYGSQNIEIDLKKAIFDNYGVRDVDDVLREIEELEGEAARWSDLTLAVTEADRARLVALGAGRTLLAANGIRPWHAGDDVLARWRAQLPSVPWLLYVASAHPPNFQGFLPSIGESLACIPPDSRLVIAGSVGPHIEQILSKSRWRDINMSRIRVLGVLGDEDLAAVKTLAHGYVLPLLDGGGSNIKTAEALYSGKHVIATSVSLRGYEAFRGAPGVHIADEPRAFRAGIREVLSSPEPVLSWADELARDGLSWERCLANVPNGVRDLLRTRELPR